MRSEAEEIFRTVVKHLVKMTHQSKDDSDQCMYRAPDGNKCAVGALITDEEYDPGMEHNPIEFLCSEFPQLGKFFPHRYLLDRLRYIHDYSPNWANNKSKMVECLHTLAKDKNFNTDILAEFKREE